MGALGLTSLNLCDESESLNKKSIRWTLPKTSREFVGKPMNINQHLFWFTEGAANYLDTPMCIYIYTPGKPTTTFLNTPQIAPNEKLLFVKTKT